MPQPRDSSSMRTKNKYLPIIETERGYVAIKSKDITVGNYYEVT